MMQNKLEDKIQQAEELTMLAGDIYRGDNIWIYSFFSSGPLCVIRYLRGEFQNSVFGETIKIKG